MQQGRAAEALEVFDKAHRLKPEWPAPLVSLSWILATSPDPKIRDESRALRLAEQAVKLSEQPAAEVLDTLGVAYAAAGQYDRAIKATRQAIELAADQAEYVDTVRKRLELYKQKKPYREPVAVPAE